MNKFKIGEIIVCVENKYFDALIHIYKQYTVVDTVEYGKYVLVRNNLNNLDWYDVAYFKPLNLVRIEKINLLFDDV